MEYHELPPAQTLLTLLARKELGEDCGVIFVNDDDETVTIKSFGFELQRGLSVDGYIWEQRYEDGKPVSERVNVYDVIQAIKILS